MRNLLQSNEFRENRNARFPHPASPRLGLTGRLPSCTRRWAGKGGGALLGEGGGSGGSSSCTGGRPRPPGRPGSRQGRVMRSRRAASPPRPELYSRFTRLLQAKPCGQNSETGGRSAWLPLVPRPPRAPPRCDLDPVHLQSPHPLTAPTSRAGIRGSPGPLVPVLGGCWASGRKENGRRSRPRRSCLRSRGSRTTSESDI